MRCFDARLAATVTVLIGGAHLRAAAVPVRAHTQPHRSSPIGAMANVRNYGAVGDGRTDDTAAIQRAVDAGRGGVWLPKGRYRITRPIAIELDRVGPTSVLGDGSATIVMAGAGPALHLVGTHTGTADPATVKPNVWQNQRAPSVDAIEIVGDHPEAIGIRAERTMQPIFSRLTIRKALHAIHLTVRNRNVIVSECHLYENRGVGVYMDHVDLHQINVANCHISYNGGGGVVLRHSSVRNLQIGTCDIEGNMAAGGPPTANILIDTHKGTGMQNWDVREGTIVGCTIQHTGKAPDSANVRFIGRDEDPPLSVGRFTIAHNAMSDVAVNIHLKHARGVVITGNTLWRGFKHNLLIEGSTHVLIGPNLLERNRIYKPLIAHNGVRLRDCRECTLTGLHLHDTKQPGAGLVLQRCRWCNITNCLIVDCHHAGVLLENVEHTRLSDCIIRDTRPKVAKPIAVRLTSGKANMIVNNLLAGQTQIASGSAHIEGNHDGR